MLHYQNRKQFGHEMETNSMHLMWFLVSARSQPHTKHASQFYKYLAHGDKIAEEDAYLNWDKQMITM